jgi:hypothetical protein
MVEIHEELRPVEVIRSEGDFKCDHYKETQVHAEYKRRSPMLPSILYRNG